MYFFPIDINLPGLELGVNLGLSYVDNWDFEWEFEMMEMTNLTKFPCDINIPIVGALVSTIWGMFVLCL